MALKNTIAHGMGGALFACAWFIFFDGLVIAKHSSAPYAFLMWLPGILATFGFGFFGFVVLDHLINTGDDGLGMMMGFNPDEENTIMRTKILFLIGSFFFFTGLGVAIWKLIDTYATSDNPTWPGVAMILQCCVLTVSAVVLAIGRRKTNDDALLYS